MTLVLLAARSWAQPTRAPLDGPDELPLPSEALPAEEAADPPREEADSGALSRFGEDPDCADCYDEACWEYGPGYAGWATTSLHRLHEFCSRSSSTHGRAVGLGQPLRGTSWLNRPYEVSVDVGALLMLGRPSSGVSAGNDKFVALRAGWDWDHYWGAQGRIGWSTPYLRSEAAAGSGGDNLFLLDLSLMYYPWGDSRTRPYWRMGMGLTDIEFTNIHNVRQQEHLFTIPFGVGAKHQFRRWLVGRVEIVDNLALGMNGANTMNNLTITAGLEARYGGRPSSYWAWRPRGGSW